MSGSRSDAFLKIPNLNQERRQSLVLHLQTEAHLVVDHAQRSQLGQNGEQTRKVGARRPVLIHVSSQRVDVELLNCLHFLRVMQIWSLCFFGGERKEKRDRVSLFENIRKSNISIGWLSTQLLTAEYHDDREQGILSVVHLQKPHVLTEVEYLVTVIADRGRSIVLSGCKRAEKRIRMIIIVIDRIIMGDEIVQDQ